MWLADDAQAGPRGLFKRTQVLLSAGDHVLPGLGDKMPDGTIIVRAKTKSILDMAGMLKAPKGKHVSVDDMNPWR